MLTAQREPLGRDRRWSAEKRLASFVFVALRQLLQMLQKLGLGCPALEIQANHLERAAAGIAVATAAAAVVARKVRRVRLRNCLFIINPS